VRNMKAELVLHGRYLFSYVTVHALSSRTAQRAIQHAGCRCPKLACGALAQACSRNVSAQACLHLVSTRLSPLLHAPILYTHNVLALLE
jgi:hypothetical protein